MALKHNINIRIKKKCSNITQFEATGTEKLIEEFDKKITLQYPERYKSNGKQIEKNQLLPGSRIIPTEKNYHGKNSSGEEKDDHNLLKNINNHQMLKQVDLQMLNVK